MIVRVGTLALACALVLGVPAHAGVIDKAQKAEASTQAWSAWGGDIGFRWNRGLLKIIGVTIESSPANQLSKTDFRRHEWFDVRESGGLEFGETNAVSRIIYVAVGVAALYELALLPALLRNRSIGRPHTAV